MSDGRVNNGGARPGSGRRADPIKVELRKALDEAIPFDDRKNIFEMQANRARAGDTRAATLILAYLYGKPTETVEMIEAGSARLDLSQLSAEELETFERLLRKATANADTGGDPGGEGPPGRTGDAAL